MTTDMDKKTNGNEDVAAAPGGRSYSPPRIITHSAEEIESRQAPVNGCVSYSQF